MNINYAETDQNRCSFVGATGLRCRLQIGHTTAHFARGDLSTANYLTETDFLAEAGAILRGETRKVATLEHLRAVVTLVRLALGFVEGINYSDGIDRADWLAAAEKVRR